MFAFGKRFLISIYGAAIAASLAVWPINYPVAADDIFQDIAPVSAFAGLDPPRTFIDEEGEISGTSVQLVQEFLNKTGINYSIYIVPWARALRTVNEDDRSLIFNIGRTTEREDHYYWILPLSEFTDSLITRNDINLTKLSQAEIIEGGYKAACEHLSLQCNLLLQYGFKAENIVQVSDMAPFQLLTMLNRNRVDFIAANYRGLFSGDIKGPVSEENFAIIESLNTTVAYLAAPKNIDPEVITALQHYTASPHPHKAPE